MNKKLTALAVSLVTGTVVLTGCGMYEIDRNAVNAVKVEGTANLWRFCDGPTLVYYQDFDGAEDEIVAMFWGACTPEGGLTGPQDDRVVGGDTGNG
jgi:hypothetical protein